MKWYVWGEKQKKKFLMWIEPTTFRTPVGCSNHWATENSVVSRSITMKLFITNYDKIIINYDRTIIIINQIAAKIPVVL